MRFSRGGPTVRIYLHEGALDLTDVESRVHTLADVHHHVHAPQQRVARQAVHLHFRTHHTLCSQNRINITLLAMVEQGPTCVK